MPIRLCAILLVTLSTAPAQDRASSPAWRALEWREWSTSCQGSNRRELLPGELEFVTREYVDVADA